MKVDAEVGVVGLGTMGSMALWRLAAAGVPAIGFERFNLAHDRSAAGGETRQFRSQLLEPFVLGHMALSERLYRDLEIESGADLLRLTGGLTFGHPDSAIVQGTLARACAEAYPIEVLDADDLAARYPQHRVAADDIALRDEASGYIRPEFSVAAAVRSAAGRGALVRDHCHVVAVLPEDGYVRIVTAEGEYFVRRAIVTAGPWAPELTDLTAARTHVRRIIMTWFPALAPEEFAPERFPTWSIALEDGTPAFGVPTVDGGSVKVAIVESYGDFLDANALDHSIRPEELRRVTELVHTRFPGLQPTAVRQSVHMDLFTSDGQPVVDRSTVSDDIVLASGFSGRGFKLAPAVGETLARAALGDDSLLLPQWRSARFDGLT